MSEAMMFTGKRGAGKTLGALFVAKRYLREGRIVATNVDLILENLTEPWSKTHAIRLPDHPSADDLNAMGLGNPDPTNESRNGLLLLDELSTFLNSREWQGKGRGEVLAWLVQSRKFGWDLLLLAQHPKQIDVQVRDSLVELHGVARRADKIRVPVLGPLWKFITGKPLKFPKVHFISLLYGFDKGAPISDRFAFFGRELYSAYNSLQKINPITGNQHLYTLLPAWHVKGRYMSKMNLFAKAASAAAVTGLIIGGIAGWWGGRLTAPKPEAAAANVPAQALPQARGVIADEGRYRLILADGRVALASEMQADAKGVRYLVEGQWMGVQK